MNVFDPGKVVVEYRDDISPLAPVEGRRYTMTHSDDTAQLYVTVGNEFAQDKIEAIRDEVRLEIKLQREKLQLVGSVLIDSEELQGKSELRNRIFMTEMPLALKAIRYGDAKLYDSVPKLDRMPVFIEFQSMNPVYNRVEGFGEIGEYRYEGEA